MVRTHLLAFVIYCDCCSLLTYEWGGVFPLLKKFGPPDIAAGGIVGAAI